MESWNVFTLTELLVSQLVEEAFHPGNGHNYTLTEGLIVDPAL